MRCVCLIWILSVATTLQLIQAQYSSYHQRRYSTYRGAPPVHSYSITTFGAGPNTTINQKKDRDGEPVLLEIYYETNCPDSMRFITQQLYPLYREMKDILKIQLIPFGKATAKYNEISKQYDFNCHHGPPECYGNTVQSCAISLYPNYEDHLNFINCMESYPRPSSAGEKCARRLSLDWKKLSKCANGEEGNRLLYQYSKLTESLNPQLNFVPWIVVNKVYSPEQQRKSLRNLKQVVCDNIKNQHQKCGRHS